MLNERLGVITDEVSEDFIEALDWIQEMNLSYIEVRMVNGKNICNVDPDTLKWMKKEIDKRHLTVAGISSPIFKCALDPSREVASGDTFGQEEEDVDAHFQKLEHTISIAKLLETNKIRIFSFWREKQPENYEAEIVSHLQRAAKIAENHQVLLLLENEGSCNGGAAKEVAGYVASVASAHVQVLWDPGNEQFGGSESFPAGYEQVKDLLGHVHIKDAINYPNKKSECVPAGQGQVPYAEQLKALQAAGYSGTFIIETHYIPEGGTKMEGTRQSLEGIRNIIRSIS